MGTVRVGVLAIVAFWLLQSPGALVLEKRTINE